MRARRVAATVLLILLAFAFQTSSQVRLPPHANDPRINIRPEYFTKRDVIRIRDLESVRKDFNNNLIIDPNRVTLDLSGKKYMGIDNKVIKRTFSDMVKKEGIDWEQLDLEEFSKHFASSLESQLAMKYNQEGISVEVNSGESLSLIIVYNYGVRPGSKIYRKVMEGIKEANNISNEDLIVAGSYLWLPYLDYKVEEGECLSQIIIDTYNVSCGSAIYNELEEQIIQINELSSRDHVISGQLLLLPN